MKEVAQYQDFASYFFQTFHGNFKPFFELFLSISGQFQNNRFCNIKVQFEIKWNLTQRVFGWSRFGGFSCDESFEAGGIGHASLDLSMQFCTSVDI